VVGTLGWLEARGDTHMARRWSEDIWRAYIDGAARLCLCCVGGRVQP
jgi:hypothetical protein